MRKAGLIVVVLVLLAAAWSGLWVWGAREAGRQLDQWIAAEADQGRGWTCPDRTFGGYPFALTIACRDVTFTGEAMGQGVGAEVARLEADVSLWHPRDVALTLTPPFSYKTSDSATNLGATWSALELDLDGLPNIQAVALSGTKVAVAGAFGDEGRQSGSATRIAARFTLPPADGAPSVGFDIAVEGAPIAALDQLVGGTAPADVALAGTLEKADIGDARTPEEAIDHWRTAGGRLVLDAGSLSRDGAKVTGSGSLSLDAAHRPQGRLDAQFVGLEPILARYGISGNLAAAGSLLSALFGSGKPAAPVAPGALALPISLRNGHVGIGPIETAVELPPLY